MKNIGPCFCIPARILLFFYKWYSPKSGFSQKAGSESQNVHQNDVNDQHNDGHGKLGKDDGIFALGLQQCGGHDVEVGSHRGNQSTAVAGSQAQRTDV